MARLSEMFGARETETFLGLPECRDLSRLDARIAIVGADCCTPYKSVGAYCAGGPAAIRQAATAYAAGLGHVNFDLGGPVFPGNVSAVDAGDLPQDPEDPSGNRSRIFGAINQILDRRAIPVLLGGDDSVQIPLLEAYGARESAIHVLQIDAHIDWRDNVGGERLGLSSTMRRASEMAHVAGILQAGQRGIGSARLSDLSDAEAWGVTFVPAGEIVRNGVGAVLSAIPRGANVVICLDLDALDPSVMPAVIGRTAGGLSYWQILEMVAGVAQIARIAGLGIVEFMPDRDVDGLGAQAAAQILTSAIGLIARQEAGVPPA